MLCTVSQLPYASFTDYISPSEEAEGYSYSFHALWGILSPSYLLKSPSSNAKMTEINPNWRHLYLKHRRISKPDRIKAMIDNKVGKITKKEIMELCPNIRKYLHHSAQKSLCCGEYVYSTFFMPCYSCACLMGVSVLLHCCICGRTGLLPYMERNRNI